MIFSSVISRLCEQRTSSEKTENNSSGWKTTRVRMKIRTRSRGSSVLNAIDSPDTACSETIAARFPGARARQMRRAVIFRVRTTTYGRAHVTRASSARVRVILTYFYVRTCVRSACARRAYDTKVGADVAAVQTDAF